MTDVLSEAAAAAWLEVLGALMSNVAHRSSNVLNAAAINLQVLVSRLSPANVPDGMSGAELSSRTFGFAEQASNALGATSELVLSMLALARPLPTPVDPARMVNDIMRVVTAAEVPGALGIVGEVHNAVLPREAGPVARLAIAAGVQAMHRPHYSGRVVWEGLEVRLERVWHGGPAGGEEPMLKEEIVRILDEAGFAVRAQTGVITFFIPV